MNIPVIQNATKPNRATETKNMAYHANYGRWVVYASHTHKHYEHMKRIKINRNYVQANKQWDNQEDLSNFLLDTSGQNTNRIKVELNYLQITLNQYVGSAERISMSSRCKSYSPLVHTRKEQSLNEMLAWTEVAKQSSPEFAETIQANKPVGRSDAETAQMHGNYYSDKYVETVNNIMKHVEVVNNFTLMQKEGAEALTLTGMYVVKPTPSSSDLKMEWIQTDDFYFDREAKKYDLSDANYMGDSTWALPTEVMERTKMLNDDILAIEAQNVSFTTEDRMPVYRSYWRDIDMEKSGYIKNEFGDIVLERIDYKYEDDEKVRYTESDVINTSELTPYQLKTIRKKKGSGKAMTTLPTEIWRYVEFVPSEYISTTSENRERVCNDLVLEYGKAPYQDNAIYCPFDMKPPFKTAIYLYIEGDVSSPLDIAINPQRMANRIMSATENMINNASGSGPVFSKEAVDKSDFTAAQIAIKVKRNEAIILPTAMFGGVPNAIGRYDTSIGSGAQNMINVGQMLLQSIENMTGVNNAMKGQMDSPDQLVGTMQLMIQRGSVVQQRFMSALQECFRQLYQSAATVGKRLYINERPKLVAMVGDEGAKILELSRDMLMEEFLAEVTFTNDKETERQYVDTTVMALLQGGLLDQTRASILLGRGSVDDMWTSTREYANEVSEMKKQMAEQQQIAGQQEAEQQQGNFDKTIELEENKTNAGLEKELIKNDGRKPPEGQIPQ